MVKLIAKRKLYDRLGEGGTNALNNITNSTVNNYDSTTDTQQVIENYDYTDIVNAIIKFSYSITVEDPDSSEDISIAFTNRAITITEMRAVLVGSSTPSVTWTIRHGTDRSAAGAEVVTGGTTTTSTSSGSDVTSFNDATIVADSHIWLETTAQSGTVNSISITIIGGLG